MKSLDKIPTHKPTLELATERTKEKKSKIKLQQEYINEIIANEKDISDNISWNCFKYQNLSLLEKD